MSSATDIGLAEGTVRPRSSGISENEFEVALEGFGDPFSAITTADRYERLYDFDDGAQQRSNERIEDALDPNGISAPGKQTIWPEHLREEGF